MKVMVSFFCEWWLYSRFLLLFSCHFHFDIIDINGNPKHNFGEFLEKSSTRGPNNYDLELNCNDPLWRKAWSKIGKTRNYISLCLQELRVITTSNQQNLAKGKHVPKVEKYTSKKVMLFTELEETWVPNSLVTTLN